VPSGISGTVIDVAGVTREGIDARQARPRRSSTRSWKRYKKDLADQMPSSRATPSNGWSGCSIGKTANKGPKKLVRGTKITKSYLEGVERHDWFEISLGERGRRSAIGEFEGQSRPDPGEFDAAFEAKRKKLTQGDELPPGVQKMVEGLRRG